MINYPKRLQLAQVPTPLIPLTRLSQQLGGPTIWIKRDDLTGSASSGNKVRKLEFLLQDAIDQGCDTVITSGGVQSNHCRSTAILCAQLGLKCHLILRADRDAAPIGNLLLDQLAGAEISHFSKQDYNADLQGIFRRLSDNYAAIGSKAYCIPTGGSNGVGVWGYIRCAEELKADFAHHGIQPTAIVHATGSAGTQAGLSVANKMLGLNTQVWGMAVCDDNQWFIDRVRSDLVEWQQRYQIDIDLDAVEINCIDDYAGPAYGVAIPEVFTLIQQVARTEGVVLDPVYTGKGFYGLVEEIKKGRWQAGEDVVFIHTGGIFGMYAQADQLQW